MFYLSSVFFWSIFKSSLKRKETNYASYTEKKRDYKKQMHAHRENNNKTLKAVGQ